MWMIRTKDGLEVTEKEVKCWDNIPHETEIQSVAVAIPRNGAKPYIVEVKDYEEVCVGRIGSVIGAGPARLTGFAIFAVANRHVTEFTIQADGIRMKGYPRDKMTLRPDCLRRMVSDGA